MRGQQKDAQPPYSAQTGWSVRRNLYIAPNGPPRPLLQRRRNILLISRPPLLCEEGNAAHPTTPGASLPKLQKLFRMHNLPRCDRILPCDG